MATLRRKKRRRIHVVALDLIREGIDLGITPAQIHQSIVEAKLDEKDVPVLRTVERIVSEEARDREAAWSLVDSRSARETRIILRVVKAVITWTEGRITSLTLREADHVLQVATSAPDLDEITVWRLAREYIRREDQGTTTLALDAYLSFTPWREEVWRSHVKMWPYVRAVKSRAVPPPPRFLVRLVGPANASSAAIDAVKGRIRVAAGADADDSIVDVPDSANDDFELSVAILFKQNLMDWSEEDKNAAD